MRTQLADQDASRILVADRVQSFAVIRAFNRCSIA
jgi:hypothetical protein